MNNNKKNPIVKSAHDFITFYSVNNKQLNLLKMLENCDPTVISLIENITSYGNHSYKEYKLRTTISLMIFSTVQLVDDLSDNECTYIDNPLVNGPLAQEMMSQYFNLALINSSIPRETIKTIIKNLLTVGYAQQKELETDTWNYEKTISLATNINGTQYGTYFLIAFTGTPYDSDAYSIGVLFGEILHIVGDRLKKDSRWISLSTDDQEKLRQWAIKRLHQFEENAFLFLADYFDFFEKELSSIV